MPSQKTTPDAIEKEKQTIREVAGLPAGNEITLNDRGWDSRVYSFNNDQYFFKFPRSEAVQSGYTYEIAAIKFAASIDSRVRIQKILWEHPANAYFGYEGVQGTPLNKQLAVITDSEKQNIGEVMGDFLKLFHQLKLPNARTMTLDDEAQQIQRWYASSLVTIQDYFTNEEQGTLHELVYKTWPARLQELGSDPVLSHGDLHLENILYSKEGHVGVIDFGDVAYYDRSKDFLELNDSAIIFDAALQAYGTASPELMEKIVVRQAMIQIINLGFHAGKDDTENIEKTAQKIKQYLH